LFSLDPALGHSHSLVVLAVNISAVRVLSARFLDSPIHTCSLLCWQVHLCEGKKENSVDKKTVKITIGTVEVFIGEEGAFKGWIIDAGWLTNYRSMRLWVCGVYFPEPHTEVYYVRLNFNISKLVYLKVISSPYCAVSTP